MTPTTPPPLEMRLDMSERELSQLAADTLTDVHVLKLPDRIGHPSEDVGYAWRADGSAIVTVHIWQGNVPPFPHAAVIIDLEVKDERVTSVPSVTRRSFGA